MRPVEESILFSTAASGTSFTKTHIFILRQLLGGVLRAIVPLPAVD
jgi:hypothetical protein